MTTLYKMTQNSLLSWSITTDDSRVIIEHGQIRGKKQVDFHDCGNAHEALVEMDRRIAIKKTKQGYKTTIPNTVPELPMLVSLFNPSKLPNTVYIQPKLDGLRCIASCDKMMSRRGEPITSMPHIADALKKLPPGIKLDGELYCHGKNFQEHLSIIKRDQPHPAFASIIYNVFDIQVDSVPYNERFATLFDIVDKLNSRYIFPIPTLTKHKDEVVAIAAKMFKDYEGVVIRDPTALYHNNTRHSSIQKYKWTYDVECQIVDIVAPATGREEGAAIFVCELNGVHFKVRPKGETVYIRKSLYENRTSLIGHWTRVTHEGLANSGKPLKPRAFGYARKAEDLQ